MQVSCPSIRSKKVVHAVFLDDVRTFGYVRRRWFAQKDWPREVTTCGDIDLVPEDGDTVQLARSSFSKRYPERGGEIDFVIVVEE
jgi:hypothetical protein